MSTGGDFLDYHGRFQVDVESSPLEKLNREILKTEQQLAGLASGAGRHLTGLERSMGITSSSGLKFQSQLRSIGGEFKTLTGHAGALSPAFDRVRSSAERLGGAAGIAGALFSATLGKGLLDTIGHASDLNESINKTQVIFGSASDKVLAFGRNSAESIGASNSAALEGIARFGNLFKTVGLASGASADMSIKLASLAADLGSLHNVDPTDMLVKIQAGLVGEAEPLRTVGILLSEAAVKQEAYRSGLAKAGAELTEAQKVLARYQIILSQGATAQGDFANTSTGVANASRIVQAQFQNLSADVGRLLLPTVQKLLSVASGVIKWFSDMPDPVKETAVALVSLGAAAGPAAFLISGIGTALTALTGPIGLVIGAVGLLAFAYSRDIGGLKTTSQEIFGELKTLYKNHESEIAAFKDAVVFNFKATTSLVGVAVGNLTSTVRVGMLALHGEWGKAWALTKETAERNIAAWRPILDKGKDVASLAWAGITEAFKTGAKVVWATAQETWERLPEIVSFYVDQVPEYLGFVGGVIAGKIGDISASMLESLGSGLDSLLAETGIFGETWTDTLANVVGLAVKGFSEGIWKIPGLVMDALGSAVEFLEGLPARMFDIGIRIAGGLWDGFSSGFDVGASGNAGSLFSGLFGNLSSGLGGGASQFEQHLKDAIKDASDRVDEEFSKAMAKAGGNAGAAAAKKIKEKLDASSPFLTERVLAGNPAALSSMMATIGKDVGRSFLTGLQSDLKDAQDFMKPMLDSIKEFAGESLPSGFFDEFEQSAKSSLQKLGEAVTSTRNIVQKELEQMGVIRGFGDRLRESVTDVVLKEMGITKESWLAMSKSMRADVDALIKPAVDIYVDAIRLAEITTKAAVEEMKKELRGFFEEFQKGSISFRQFGQLIKGQIKTEDFIDLEAEAKHWESFGISVEKTLDRQTKSVMTWSDAVDAATNRVRDSLLSSIGSFDKMRLAADGMVRDSISQFEALARSLGLTGKAYDDFVINHVEKSIKQLEVSLVGATEIERARIEEQIRILKEAGPRILKEYTDSINQLPGALNKTFDKMLDVLGVKDLQMRSKIKGTVAGIIEIIGALDVGVGKELNKVVNSVIGWINRIDVILKGLHKVWAKVPDGLDKAVEKIIGLFKKTEKEAQTSTSVIVDGYEHIIDSVKGSSGESGAASGKSFSEGFLGKMGLITAGLTTFFGTRGQGKLTGMLGGAMAGAQIGSMFGPWGTAIGAGVGFFAGLFRSGKSEEQKRAEEEAKKRAADEAKLFAEELKQSYIKSLRDTLALASEAREYLEGLAGRVHVPKEEIRKAFAQLGLIVKFIVEESKKHSKEVMKAAKQFSESFGPSMTLLAGIPQATEGINRHMPLSLASVQSYFADFRIIAALIGVEAEQTPNKLEKEIAKFTKRVGPAFDMLPAATEGINAALNLEKPNAEGLKNYGGWLDLIIEETGKLATKYDRFLIKIIEFFSSRVLPGVSLFRETVGTIKEAIDIPRLNIYTIRGVYADLELITNEGIAFTSRVPISELDRAAVVAGKVTPWLNALKLAGEAFIPFKDYQSVKEELNVLLGDFEASAFIMRAMEDFSDQMEQRSIKIHAHLTNSARLMTEAIKGFGEALSKLSSVLLGGLSTTSFIVNPEAVGVPSGLPASGSKLAFAPTGGGYISNITPSFKGTSFGGSSAPPSQPTVIQQTFTGDIVLPNVKAEDLEDIPKIKKALGGLQQALRAKR